MSSTTDREPHSSSAIDPYLSVPFYQFQQWSGFGVTSRASGQAFIPTLPLKHPRLWPPGSPLRS